MSASLILTVRHLAMALLAVTGSCLGGVQIVARKPDSRWFARHRCSGGDPPPLRVRHAGWIGAPLLPIRVVAVRARTSCISRLVASALLIASSNVPPQITAFEHGATAPKMCARLPVGADIARFVGHPSAQ